MTETKRSYPAVLAVTGVALFMIVLDNLIVLSSLPSIERSLGATLEQLEWVVDAYILSFAVLMLTGAALGERFGRRRMLVVGLLLFTGSSAAAALSTGSGMLIAARVIQGVGGAILMPLTLTLLTTNVPTERRASALGMWSAIAGLGVALGPIAGGLLTSALSWHWIFWLNVPVGIAAAVAAPRASHWPPPACSESSGRPCAATARAGARRRRSPPTAPARWRSSRSSGGRPPRRIRCCRSGSSAGGRSRSPTARAS
jgi:MFS family permease